MAGLTADPFQAARLVLHLRQQGVTDPDVLAAMETLDRAAFVEDPALAPLAFEDAVLPIPCGQVILRPSLTGHLVQALGLKPSSKARVLLVGFGAGYMAALLARLAGDVVAVERYRRLVDDGRARMARLGIENVTLLHGDGLESLAGQGPFNAIVLAGRVTDLPADLASQLAPGGVLAAPIGPPDGPAHLVRITAEGETRHVPLFQSVPSLAPGRAQVL
ncbi:MAG: protein-L-isoaspartate O-methyltransferase family protein [Pannonibacter indicus]